MIRGKVTGHQTSGPTWAQRQTELARLRTFCLLNAILYLIVAVLTVFAPVLLAGIVDSPVNIPLPTLVQNLLCAIALVVLASLLLGLRAAIAHDPAVQGSAIRAARTTRVLALVVAVLIVVAGTVAFLTTSTKLSTAAVSIVAVVFALYAYVGAAKLR